MFADLPDSAVRSSLSDTELDAAITEWTTAIASATGHRLLLIAEKTRRNYTDDLDTDEDTEAAWKSAANEVALATGTSPGRASGDMEIGVALATKLPKIAALLLAGQISEYLARRIVYRTDNIVDPELLAQVETNIAEAAVGWGTLSVKKLDDAIDVWVHRYDPAALRKVRVRVRDRGVDILETKEGVTTIVLRLKGVDAALYWQRITLMAQGVCKDDPRTLDQRRADAHGALGAGFLHLACECGSPGCPAADDDGRASHVFVHIYGEAATLDAEPDPLMDGDSPLPADPNQRPMSVTLVYPDGTRVLPDGTRVCPDEAEESENTDTDADDDTTSPSDRAFKAQCRGTAQSEHRDMPEVEPDPERIDTDTTTATEAATDEPVSPDTEADTDTTPAAEAATVEPVSPDTDRLVAPAAFVNPPPGILVGFGAVPAALVAALIAKGAIVRHLQPPGIDPEDHYRASTALDDWCKARDLTCRWPNCDLPAQFCDFDHTTPWPAGTTHASGGKMFCRTHHGGKTFWPGWSDSQAPDGTITFTTPTGRTYQSKPGSSLFFPTINTTSAPIDTPPPEPNPPDKIGAIPKHRRRNRARERAYRIKAERAHNDAHPTETPVDVTNVSRTYIIDHTTWSHATEADDPPPF